MSSARTAGRQQARTSRLAAIQRSRRRPMMSPRSSTRPAIARLQHAPPGLSRRLALAFLRLFLFLVLGGLLAFFLGQFPFLVGLPPIQDELHKQSQASQAAAAP